MITGGEEDVKNGSSSTIWHFCSLFGRSFFAAHLCIIPGIWSKPRINGCQYLVVCKWMINSEGMSRTIGIDRYVASSSWSSSSFLLSPRQEKLAKRRFCARDRYWSGGCCCDRDMQIRLYLEIFSFGGIVVVLLLLLLLLIIQPRSPLICIFSAYSQCPSNRSIPQYNNRWIITSWSVSVDRCLRLYCSA